MNSYIYPIVFLALIATLGYFLGKKKNKWIAGWVSRETESVLKPLDTEYVNIGGSIGYNFTYKLKGAFKKASGTIITLPRHSVFYFPISLLTTRYDRFYLNIRSEGKMDGEGHIISSSFLGSARRLILDYGSFKTDKYISKGQTFHLLWRAEGLGERLKQFLDKCESSNNLRHFCCHAENKNFFFLVKPSKGELGRFLESAVPSLGLFYIKGREDND